MARRRPLLLRGLSALLLIGALAAAWWWLKADSGKGQPEDPARVLIVGPTPALVDLLEREGFDADLTSPGSAISEGRKHDPTLDGLAAMLEYADREGIGYLAVDLAHGERHDFASLRAELELELRGVGSASASDSGSASASASASASDSDSGSGLPPPGATFAVLGVGDLAGTLSFGGPIPEVAHQKPAGEFVGLMLALFAQPELAKALRREATNDLMIRFDSAGAIDDLRKLERAREGMARQAQRWRELADGETPEGGAEPGTGGGRPVELAAPFEHVQAWPLANGSVLLASLDGAWHSADGLSSSWGHDSNRARLWVRSWDAQSGELGPREPCPDLPESVDLDAFRVAPGGDALLLPANRWSADLWVLRRTEDGALAPGCAFERLEAIRRLHEGELGQAQASGRTAQILEGRLQWADVKMRAYRQVQLRGLELRDHGLRWAGEATVVAPGMLAPRETAEGAPNDDAAPVLVWLRLPPPRVEDRVEVAVVPLAALVAPLITPAIPPDGPEAPPPVQPSDYAILDVFPLPGSLLAALVLLDGPSGASLIRVTWPEGGPPWANALATGYDLDAVLRSNRGAITVELAAAALPDDAHDLSVASDGRRAAWVAAVTEDQDQDQAGESQTDPQRHLEVFTLHLDDPTRPGPTPPAPARLTHNTRSDSQPRFAGPEGQLLLIDSRYRTDDRLPVVDSARAIVLGEPTP